MRVRKTLDGTTTVRAEDGEVDDKIRITIFPDDPNLLLVYVPDGMTAVLPPIDAPFAMEAARASIKETDVPFRVSEGVIGRHLREVVRARKNDARAERRNVQLLSEAISAAMGSGSISSVARERSEVLKQKIAVEEELRRAKAYLGDVRADAATRGVYLSRDAYALAEKNVNELKGRAMVLATRLSELKKREKEENIAKSQAKEEHFKQAAGRILDRETYLSIWREAERIAEGDS